MICQYFTKSKNIPRNKKNRHKPKAVNTYFLLFKKCSAFLLHERKPHKARKGHRHYACGY